jgi:assimilatory nitrate reductase catalytic subunit
MARDVLDRLEFLVVQDMYHTTETAQQAHLVLPAAGWGEKEGTFINSERRVGLTSKVRRAPGEALADFHIFKLVADYWGCDEMFRAWESPAATFGLLKQLSAGQPCEITGIDDYGMLADHGGVQWPLPADRPDARRERRLFEDGRFYHADGRARFLCETPRPLPEAPNATYPFLLLTGRGSAAQWHTQTRTAKSAVLRKLYPSDLHAELNPKDAARLGVRAGDIVSISSQRGELRARAHIAPTVQPGQVFLPMHDEQTNRLTDAVFDPYSHQPAYKACAVAIERPR